MKRLIVFAVPVVAALISMAVAAPAQAGQNAAPRSSCQQDGSCAVSLSSWIKYSGNAYTPGDTGQVPVEETQPPCLWEPKGNQITGSHYVIDWFDGVPPTPNEPFNLYGSWQQAHQLLANGGNPAGEWYELPVNPADTPQEIAECDKEPLFYFAAVGTIPPLPPIPPRILGEYAYNHMHLASPAITTSPAGKGFVNLATFVWWQFPQTQHVTAALPDGQAATVVAEPEKESITVSPAGSGTVYTSCQADTGSAYPTGKAPATNAGQAPDCGVLWTQAATGATITVTVTWQVVFHPGTSTAFFGNPVAGDPDPITRGTTAPATVTEIQSVNGP